jgi:cytochrome c-type biogenesis protein CcmF
MLYLGYVGMVVPFALAMSALCTGKLGHDLLVPLRRWLMVPWLFLTVGIVLGGWWAYEVFGWGGYWAWDPVENASLLPWLTATAALHSLLVVERRGMLKGWATTLVICTFLLTILGTFMTRSGIFNSVDSFTQSDIGPTFLVFLGVLVMTSLGMLSARISTLAQDSAGFEDGKSREVGILVSNFMFVLLTFTVLLGTVFPLIWEAWDGVQISVGEPYFNLFGVPLGVAVLFLVGVGPSLPWGRGSLAELQKALLRPFVGAAAVAAIGFVAGLRNGWTLATLFCGGYAAWVTVEQLVLPVAVRARRGAGELGPALLALLGPGRRRLGAYVAHLGVIAILIAVAVSSTAKQSTEVSLRRGDTAQLAGYSFTLDGVRIEQKPYRQETIASVTVKKGGDTLGVLEPRMNHYFTQREPIGSPAVRTSLTEDVYLSVMSLDAGSQVLGVRIFLEPLVGWIWGGMGIIVIGGLLALFGGGRRREAAARPVGRAVAAGPDGEAPATGQAAAREVGT